MADKLEALERNARSTEAKAAEARAKVEEVQQEALKAREQRAEEYDRAVFEAYSSDEWAAKETAAYRDARTALAESDWVQACANFYAVYELRRYIANEAYNLARTLGEERPHVPVHRERPFLTIIDEAIKSATGPLVADAIDERDAAREAAVEGTESR